MKCNKLYLDRNYTLNSLLKYKVSILKYLLNFMLNKNINPLCFIKKNGSIKSLHLVLVF